MSTPPKPRAYRILRTPSPDGLFSHASSPGAIAFLLVLLQVGAVVFALRLIYVLWPGSQWVEAWYGADNRAAAAAILTQSGSDRLTEGLATLARYEDPNGPSPVADQIQRLNRTLSFATELKDASRRPTADSQSDALQTRALAPGAQPLTSQKLTELRNHLVKAQSILSTRLRQAQRRADAPRFRDVVWRTLPEDKPCSPCDGTWVPVPSETTEFTKALAEIQKISPAAYLGSTEVHYLFLVFLFGTLGSCLRALTSLAAYVGNLSFRPQWSLYYLIQPLLGGGLAVAFYILLRGGFMNVANSANQVANIYAFSALAVLVGLSTKEALDKIRAIANELFSADSDLKQDQVDNKRGDTRLPIVDHVSLALDGRSGVVLGARLADAMALYIDKREMDISSKSKGSITFQVPAGTSALDADALQSVIVLTPDGSVVFHDDTPDAPAPAANPAPSGG